MKYTTSIYRSDDKNELDRIVAEHNPKMPLFDKPLEEGGKQIGTIVRVWRDGMLLMAEIEKN